MLLLIRLLHDQLSIETIQVFDNNHIIIRTQNSIYKLFLYGNCLCVIKHLISCYIVIELTQNGKIVGPELFAFPPPPPFFCRGKTSHAPLPPPVL